jgi:uncharacterized membrane protein
MTRFSIPDLTALLFFIGAWTAYHLAIERSWRGNKGLNRRMDDFRRQWMQEMATRTSRIVDASIMASLQNGAAFFASTSLIAIGGVAALLRSPEDVLKVFSEISIGLSADRALWEAKIVGLLVILGYAFFKFAWSYRLFNYAAILLGATPGALPAATGSRKVQPA